MNTQTEVLAFVKAMASADRLRVIGVLARGRATQAEIADQLHAPVRDVFDHLAYLTNIGVIHESEGFYDLNEKTIESLARGQFEDRRPQDDEKPEEVRKVLKAYLNPDGTIKQLPQEGRKMEILLKFVVEVFPFDTYFTEKEVNTILRRFHLDTAILRRNLIDYGLMARESDGTKYWRLTEPSQPIAQGPK